MSPCIAVVIWICIVMVTMLVAVKPMKDSKSRFEASAVHNQTHITVSCEHPSFKQSKTGKIFIMEQNVLAECIWDGNNVNCLSGAKALSNGIQYTMKYESSLKLKCRIGEQFVNIPVTEKTTLTPFNRPELKAKAVHNRTHVTVTCDHSPFNRSNSRVYITDNNYLPQAECIWDGTQYQCTHGAEGLFNGMQFTTEYNSSMKLKCGLNEQLVDVNLVEQSIPTFTSSMVTSYNRTFQNMSSGQGSMDTFVMAQVLTFLFLIKCITCLI